MASKRLDPNAEWNPPATHTHVSVDGRWLIDRDGKNLMLVDRHYKNTPDEKHFRALKSRIDPQWHYEQATAATAAANWYAATLHFAWLLKDKPDQASYVAGLQSSFQNLKSQYEKDGLDLEPHLATGVKETLKLPPVNESLNPSFELPPIGKRSFAFRSTVPGWKTTSRMFEIWSSGFQDVTAHDGDQFVELNANEEGTLYQDQLGLDKGAVYEFSFAHRGRNGDDTLQLSITDLGADNAIGGGDDTELFSKQYTTGKNAWAVYDSTKEPTITTLGNNVHFAFSAVSATGGKGPAKTEGNFLDAAYFGVGVVSAQRKPDGAK